MADWSPVTYGKRWHGDDGLAYPPIKEWLEENGIGDVLSELDANEVYTLDTLMLLTEEDLAITFSLDVQMKLASAMDNSTTKAVATCDSVNHTQMPILPTVVNLIPQQLPQYPATMLTMLPSTMGPSYHEFGNATQQLYNTIQQLVEERERARRVKEYSKADFIREQLRKQGIKLNDDTRTWTHPNGIIGGSWGKVDFKVR
eukprot:TRINITY_DN5618_c0_g2_i1.p1 TRINITY_DN5618_c0_g2~~TRINITY_DN5618_c0_g2_i1.p1  ORF type:complete len:223 (+),score=57.66 TRINITY_DN5618_c0_g2_i1:68-670(+)